MLDLWKKELDDKSALNGELPPYLDMIADSIPAETIHRNMKLTIAVNEIILFASQFQRNIHHWNGSEVPINGVSFIVAGSGEGKDSSVSAARKCFSSGYDLINSKRKLIAKQKAIQDAREAGEDDATNWEVYKPFYVAPNPLFVSPSTTEGFIQHLNDLDDQKMGAGFMYSGEVGAELSQNPVFAENIKLISELYDLGNKEVKVLKGRENQSKEIKGLPVSALFQGSPANILYDEQIKRKFRVEFYSKLARRSFFCFCPEKIPEKDFKHLPEDKRVMAALDYDEKLELDALHAREQMTHGVSVLAEENLAKTSQLICTEPAVAKLFRMYRRYNSALAETIPNMYPMSALVRKHLQWKALKLAGAFAIFHQHDSITEEDYIYAIRFCEMLDKDLMRFEIELVKEPYEVFSDHMQNRAKDGKSWMGLHELRKSGYIPTGSGNPSQKMKDLVHLAAAYDTVGIYTVKGTEIHYEVPVKSENLQISYREIDNSEVFAAVEAGDRAALKAAKERIAFHIAEIGFETAEPTFAELGKMLQGNYAYSPFIFKDNIRSKDTIQGGTKWLVLDVDDSCVTASEAHFMFQDINHHIALSSDSSNEFKFRVILELDQVVRLSSIVWKHFFTGVAEDLSIVVDPVAQSQIYYSYGGREVLSVLDAEPLAARDYVMKAFDKASQTTPIAEKKLTRGQIEALLNDELTTFGFAFDSPDGEGSRNMIKAAYYARDLGMSKDGIIELIGRVNDYWPSPMDETRLENTIITQILRW